MESSINRLYKIGEIADIFQISVQALRLYERDGLFVPAVINEETGYRYYKYTQFEKLRMIIFLKSIGLSLKTIKHLVEMPKGEEYVEILEDYKVMLEQRILEENAKIKFLDDKINNIRTAISLPKNKFVLQHFPATKIVRYDKPVIGAIAHETACLDFMRTCQLSPGFGKIGQFFDPAHLTENNAMVSTSIFVREELCNHIPEEQSHFIYRDSIPEGTYAALYYQKDTTESLPYMYELLDEIKRHALVPVGEIIRLIISDIVSYEGKDNGYLACIRILVRHK